MKKDYGAYFAFLTEGGRIGLATCLRCGAAVIMGDSYNTTEIHSAYHDQNSLHSAHKNTTKRKGRSTPKQPQEDI